MIVLLKNGVSVVASPSLSEFMEKIDVHLFKRLTVKDFNFDGNPDVKDRLEYLKGKLLNAYNLSNEGEARLVESKVSQDILDTITSFKMKYFATLTESLYELNDGENLKLKVISSADYSITRISSYNDHAILRSFDKLTKY